MNDNERQSYGWSERGERVFDEKPGFASRRISILAGLNINLLCAPMILDGYCDRTVVERYFEDVLLPEIGPGKIIVLDNASFHKGGKIRKIVEAFYCKLLYLPSYSPDLNPIEHYWAAVKTKIRSVLSETKNSLWDAAMTVLKK